VACESSQIAATIVLYELREVTIGETQHPDDPHERGDEHEIEGLYETFDDYLHAAGHPEEKVDKTGRLFRRFVARGHPTGREAHTPWRVLRRGAMIATGEIPQSDGWDDDSDDR